MPRGAAHTLDLDAPLVLSVELVREDRDSGAFAIGLGQVGDSLGLFLAVAEESSHGDGGPLQVLIAHAGNCCTVDGLGGGCGGHSASGEHEESGRCQRACAESRVTCQCASLSHCHAFQSVW